MKKQATRAELAAAVIDLYDELSQIKSVLSHLIDEESAAKIKKCIKQNRAA